MHTLLLFAFACLACCSFSSADVCDVAVTTSYQHRYTTKCGWFGWRRCTRYRTQHRTTYTKDCCTGSHGVYPNCDGECPNSSPGQSSVCTEGTGLCRDFTCDRSGFVSTPAEIRINENNNSAALLWSASGTSFVQSSAGVSTNVPVTRCSVVSTNGIAEVRQGTNIYRKQCSNPTCAPCGASHVGCLDHQVTYFITVSCYAPGYADMGEIEHTFTIQAEPAPRVDFGFPEDVANQPISVDSELGIGDVILSLDDMKLPNEESGITFEFSGPVSPVTGEQLFQWNDDTQQVVVAGDLSVLPSGNYTIELCAVQRRGSTCSEFTVTIVQPTTTTTTATTTTTTTTRPETTTTPSSGYICQANTDDNLPWKHIPGFDLWCERNCAHDPENCVYVESNHCTCMNIDNPMINCTAVGIWKSKAMDAWCFINCNYGQQAYCPLIAYEGPFCSCDGSVPSS